MNTRKMFNRSLINKQKIIIIDGFIGGGKSLISPVVSSLPKVNQWTMNYWFDQIVSLWHLKKIDLNTATYILKTNYNVIFYDSLLLRNSNFRKSDNSSVTNHARFKSFKQRMKPNDQKVYEKFKDKLISNYSTHMVSNFSEPFFKAFNKSLVFVKIYRSPTSLKMIKHMAKWSLKWEKIKSRDGWIKIFDKDHKKNFPHFMKNCRKEYLSANKYERAILLLEYMLLKDKFKNKNKFKNYNSKIIKVSFESFCNNPFNFLKKIAQSLNVKIDNTVKISLRRHNLPRKTNIEGERIECLKFLKRKIRNKYFLRMLNLHDYYRKNIYNVY